MLDIITLLHKIILSVSVAMSHRLVTIGLVSGKANPFCRTRFGPEESTDAHQGHHLSAELWLVLGLCQVPQSPVLPSVDSHIDLQPRHPDVV